jgi:8-oxo-dGTP pyrophosphatase MutT (NUDIX family)
MASLGPGHYVVAVLLVSVSKVSDIKFVLQTEPRFGKTWLPAGSILPNEEHVDVVVRELHEETGLIVTHVEFRSGSRRITLWATSPCLRLFGVFSRSVHLRTPAHLEHIVTTQSTINPDGSYVVPATIDMHGLSLTPFKQGLFPSMKRKYELLHFGCVTQWETFRRDAYTHQVFAMKISRYRCSFCSTLGLRMSTLVMSGCLSVATSISCVDRHRLIYNWEL